MTGLLEFIVPQRLRGVPDGTLEFHFATAPAPWIMLVGAIVAALLVYNLYRREIAAGRRRWVLMLLRFGVVMTALMLFSRPMVTLHRSHVVPSVVAVLLDKSLSMAELDAPTGPGEPSADVPAPSRWAAVTDLTSDSAGPLLAPVLETHDVEIWTVGEHAARVAELDTARAEDEARPVASRRRDMALADPASRLTTIEPDEPASNLEGGVTEVVDRLSGRPLAGIVLLSDGRRNGPEARESLTQRLSARGVPLITVGVGSPTPRLDITLNSAFADERAFTYDPVEVRLHLAFRGFEQPTEIQVVAIPEGDFEPIASRNISISPGETEWRGVLRFRPAAAGRHRFRVGARPLPAERVTDNNWSEIEIDLRDARVAVLYVEDRPRFEYRFLKNLLMREEGVESSCLLLSATSGFVQEGTRPIERFPRSIEELGQYDVVVLGDVDPRSDWLSPAQESMLVDFVSTLGGGIVFLAGEAHMPQQLRRTRLEKLLPVAIGPAGNTTTSGPLRETFQPRLTIDGAQSPILQWFESEDANAEYIAQLPGWYWAAEVGAARPGATVLLERPARGGETEPTPLVVLGRYGAGRTLYIGSDDLRRWRQIGETDAYHSFWLRAFRELARNRQLGPDRSIRIETDRREYSLGQTVHVEVHGEHDELSAVNEMRLMVRDADAAPVERLVVRRSEGGVLAGSFPAERLGVLQIAADSPGPNDLPPRRITVLAPNEELNRPEADPVYLRDLAQATGGAYFDIDGDLSAIAQLIPDRSVTLADDIEEPLWDTMLLLTVFMLLISAEWIVRKYAGLA